LSPDSRKHRGPHPGDKALFGEEQLPSLRTATSELSWLLTRGYSLNASVKLVGDHHGLKDRQRLAIGRAACSDQQAEKRGSGCLLPGNVSGMPVAIDGFNLIITLEAALSGGILLGCKDGCLRDLSSVHGSYRSVTETELAIRLIGQAIEPLWPGAVTWFLDKPVSNSGRLSERIMALSEERKWGWSVKVVMNPDSAISDSDQVAITSDSIILDRAQRWINMCRYIVERELPSAWVVNLSE